MQNHKATRLNGWAYVHFGTRSYGLLDQGRDTFPPHVSFVRFWTCGDQPAFRPPRYRRQYITDVFSSRSNTKRGHICAAAFTTLDCSTRTPSFLDFGVLGRTRQSPNQLGLCGSPVKVELDFSAMTRCPANSENESELAALPSGLADRLVRSAGSNCRSCF
jgi:hypothetical protein